MFFRLDGKIIVGIRGPAKFIKLVCSSGQSSLGHTQLRVLLRFSKKFPDIDPNDLNDKLLGRGSGCDASGSCS